MRCAVVCYLTSTSHLPWEIHREDRVHGRKGERGEETDISQVSWSPASVPEPCVGADRAGAVPVRTKNTVSRYRPWALLPQHGEGSRTLQLLALLLEFLPSTSFHYILFWWDPAHIPGTRETQYMEDSEAQRWLHNIWWMEARLAPSVTTPKGSLKNVPEGEGCRRGLAQDNSEGLTSVGWKTWGIVGSCWVRI